MEILEIRNKLTNERIAYKHIDIVKGSHKYASRKDKDVMCLQLDGKHVSKHNPYIVTYKCKTCSSNLEVGITQVLRKLQKDNPKCKHCVNKEEKQRLEKELSISTESFTMLQLKQHYEELFENEFDDDEKNAYFSYHLTLEEFNRIKNKLVSLPENTEYLPIWKSSNQMKFTAMFYNPTTDNVDKVYNLKCKCEVCDAVFPIKNLHSLKNKYKVLCKECSLCRNIFKRRAITNMLNEKVIVQSKLESKFVQWCNDNKVLVRNGPKLKYIWNDKEHTYHLDFELPELNWLIETKDNHVWHKNQVDNGRWKAKEDVAKSLQKQFTVVYPENWMRISKQILERRYSLTLCESIRS